MMLEWVIQSLYFISDAISVAVFYIGVCVSLFYGSQSLFNFLTQKVEQGQKFVRIASVLYFENFRTRNAK